MIVVAELVSYSYFSGATELTVTDFGDGNGFSVTRLLSPEVIITDKFT